jgi:SAM-dependent methyltransferase
MASPRVLIVNHGVRRCGVHQFGASFHRHVAPSTAMEVRYAEVESEDAFLDMLERERLDALVVNYHAQTLPWLTRAVVRRAGIPVIGLAHEFDYPTAFSVDAGLFSYRLLPDPSIDSRLPNVFVVPRVAPEFTPPPPAPSAVPVIGSFGFATGGKGFERIVKLVQRELDEAVIRLQIPFSYFADPDGANARDVAARCRSLVTKPGVRLEVTHDFVDEPELLAFLAANDINVFLYDDPPGRGLSSVIEMAVAAGRPIGVSESRMFRHLLQAAPACRLERSTLKDVLRDAAAPVLALKACWTAATLRTACETAVARVLELDRAAKDPARPRYNRILDDGERGRYAAAVEQMRTLVPEILAKKIERANVQQAFVKEAVERFAKEHRRPTILCVGSFEDTACHSLKKLGYEVEAIDPVSDYDLESFARLGTTLKESYDIIFSTSVIEHVPDDERFISRIHELLAPGGTAILTMDFKEGWTAAQPKPGCDCRLYTQRDILERFVPLLAGCDLVDVPDWLDTKPDFVFEGVAYSFATLVFRKRPRPAAADAAAAFDRHLRLEIADRDARSARAACDELGRQLDHIRAEADSLRRELERRDRALTAILSSKSWKVTRPLRALGVLRESLRRRLKG